MPYKAIPVINFIPKLLAATSTKRLQIYRTLSDRLDFVIHK
ncbi:MAG: hypothetical protein V7K60_33755 [Nostoc sp.]